MTIIAKFSNGFEDTYKGQRAVKAAWMITRNSDGKVMASGHSIDAIKAAKTASGNLVNLGRACGVDIEPMDVPVRQYAGASYAWLYERAEKYGFTGGRKFSAYKRWAKAHNATRRAAIEAATTVEIISI